MHLDGLDDGDDREETAQTAAARLGHGELLAHLPVDLAHLVIVGIGWFDQFSAIARKCRKDIFADGGLRTLRPVAPVDDVVGAQTIQYLIVHDVILYNDLRNLGQFAEHRHALLERLRRKAVIAHHLRIGEYADGDAAELCRRAQEVLVPCVDDIRAEAGVNVLHVFPSISFLLYICLPRPRRGRWHASA